MEKQELRKQDASTAPDMRNPNSSTKGSHDIL